VNWIKLWALGAFAISIVEQFVTFSYFLPTMLWLMSITNLPQVEVNVALSQRLLLDSTSRTTKGIVYIIIRILPIRFTLTPSHIVAIGH
jgi:hypothetical protein